MEKKSQLHVWNFGLFQSLLFSLVGLLFGVVYSFGGLIIDTLVTLQILSAIEFETPGLSYGTVLAFGALIGMPLIGGGIGLACGVVEAILYNTFVRITGGFNFKIKRPLD